MIKDWILNKAVHQRQTERGPPTHVSFKIVDASNVCVGKGMSSVCLSADEFMCFLLFEGNQSV